MIFSMNIAPKDVFPAILETFHYILPRGPRMLRRGPGKECSPDVGKQGVLTSSKESGAQKITSKRTGNASTQNCFFYFSVIQTTVGFYRIRNSHHIQICFIFCWTGHAFWISGMIPAVSPRHLSSASRNAKLVSSPVLLMKLIIQNAKNRKLHSSLSMTICL